ncbi:hypothetical protein [Streptomyces sp. SPB162]|uniref:hypothetical protein n=1 Tax=Streptomyces sp. SPB162 TaxID=2940560 RepID=UPI0024057B5D|nr:hypothetical protein [Streptomyces sp. SPB162]MDF9813119.1 hypothetical protein [Streptomyces sp. SPB162]
MFVTSSDVHTVAESTSSSRPIARTTPATKSRQILGAVTTRALRNVNVWGTWAAGGGWAGRRVPGCMANSVVRYAK